MKTLNTLAVMVLVVVLLSLLATVTQDTEMFDYNSLTYVVVQAGQGVRVHALTQSLAYISYCVKMDACYWGVVPASSLDIMQ